MAESPDWVKVTRYFTPEHLADLGSRPADGAALGERWVVEGADALEPVVLGRLDDAGHGLRTVSTGSLPTLRLAGEHERVGAVEHGVGGVGGLGAGRAGVLDHRLQHLRRDDDRLGRRGGRARRRASARAAPASSGSSTPRSPRATMMPSKASMISSRLSTACGFSILAMTGSRTPSSSMISWTSSMSSALRTNDSAMKSAPRSQRPAQVLLVLVGQRGHAHRDAGQVDALVVRDGPPPTTTSVTTSVSVASTAAGATLPSSMRMRSPALTSPGSPLYVVPTMSCVPVDVVGRDRERVAAARTMGPSANRAGADLGALEVDQDADRAAGRVAGRADGAVDASWTA